MTEATEIVEQGVKNIMEPKFLLHVKMEMKRRRLPAMEVNSKFNLHRCYSVKRKTAIFSFELVCSINFLQFTNASKKVVTIDSSEKMRTGDIFPKRTEIVTLARNAV